MKDRLVVTVAVYEGLVREPRRFISRRPVTQKLRERQRLCREPSGILIARVEVQELVAEDSEAPAHGVAGASH